MQVLEQLWANDMQNEKPYIHNRQYKEALADSTESEKAFEASLSKEQLALFEEYQKSRNTLALVTDCETYITGFKLGARIMLDVLTKGEVNEI